MGMDCGIDSYRLMLTTQSLCLSVTWIVWNVRWDIQQFRELAARCTTWIITYSDLPSRLQQNTSVSNKTGL
jgi:hypothetical protein